MSAKKNILVIIGSTRTNSSNFRLVKKLEELARDIFEIIFYQGLTELPYFNPDLDNENPPKQVIDLRQQIANADGIIVCTPEYVFSLPGSLKNAIEWCVSTTVFSQKSIGLITASASGEKAHEELRLVMRTLEARFTEATSVLIKGIKGKFNEEGDLTDAETIARLKKFIAAFNEQLNDNNVPS